MCSSAQLQKQSTGLLQLASWHAWWHSCAGIGKLFLVFVGKGANMTWIISPVVICMVHSTCWGQTKLVLGHTAVSYFVTALNVWNTNQLTNEIFSSLFCYPFLCSECRGMGTMIISLGEVPEKRWHCVSSISSKPCILVAANWLGK